MERFQDSKKNVPLQVVRLRDVQQTFRYWKRPEGPRESEEKRSLLRCTALPLIFFSPIYNQVLRIWAIPLVRPSFKAIKTKKATTLKGFKIQRKMFRLN